MMEFGVATLDAVYQEFQLILANEPSMSATLGTAYGLLRPRFNAPTVDYCLHRYVASELDYTTTGDRGLGRVSSEIPRLGAYFREQVASLRPEESARLYGFISSLVLRGYLIQGLMVEVPPQPPRWTEPDSVFERWIPNIYSVNPADFGPGLQTGLRVFTDRGYAPFMSFLNEHSMGEGGVFPQDKTGLISMYYPLAGIALRGAETGS